MFHLLPSDPSTHWVPVTVVIIYALGSSLCILTLAFVFEMICCGVDFLIKAKDSGLIGKKEGPGLPGPSSTLHP